MSDKEILTRLRIISKDKNSDKEEISFVVSLLDNNNLVIKAKALWILGELGMNYPDEAVTYFDKISALLDDVNPIIRERTIDAIGRIGRTRFETIQDVWEKMFTFSNDESSSVRLSFIWASENIATNSPFLYKDKMNYFVKLLNDPDDKVRIESPEIFRVLGKREPSFVKPYLDILVSMSTNDSNEVVRIHSLGAIKATTMAMELRNEKI